MNSDLTNLLTAMLGPDGSLSLASAVIAVIIVWAVWPKAASALRVGWTTRPRDLPASMVRRSNCGSEMHLVSVDKPVQVQRSVDGVWVVDGVACGVVVLWRRPDGRIHHTRPEVALLWIDDVEDIRRGRKQIQEQLSEIARVQAQLVARTNTDLRE